MHMDLCDVDLAHIHEARDKPSAEATHLRAQKAELAPEPRAETAGWKGTTEGLVSEDFCRGGEGENRFRGKVKVASRRGPGAQIAFPSAHTNVRGTSAIQTQIALSALLTGQKVHIAQLEADISALEVRKGAADDARLSVPALNEKMGRARVELADKCEVLTKKGLCVRRLQEDYSVID